jgi:hypothetical protein
VNTLRFFHSGETLRLIPECTVELAKLAKVNAAPTKKREVITLETTPQRITGFAL